MSYLPGLTCATYYGAVYSFPLTDSVFHAFVPHLSPNCRPLMQQLLLHLPEFGSQDTGERLVFYLPHPINHENFLCC